MTLNNSGSISSTNYIDQYKKNTQIALQRIASAKSVDSTDGASQAIYDDLKSQVDTYAQGIKNANDGVGYLQIADGVTQSLSKSADDLNVLSAQYNNGSLNQSNRDIISAQASDIKESMKQATQSASFNGKNVFSGDASFFTGGGTQSFSLSAPNVDNIDVTNQESVMSYQKQLSSLQSTIGSSSNALSASINSNMSGMVSMSSAASQIGDTDYAQAANNFNQNNLQINAATMMLAHSNSLSASSVVRLLG
jgi:flagellin